MGLFKFYWTDAIASAGGTTIKYIDTTTREDITVSNVLGAIIIDNTGYGMSPVLFRKGGLFIFYILSDSGGINVNVVISIRVFYY